MRKTILVLIAILSVTSLYAQETNILIPFNGGFENGMTSRVVEGAWEPGDWKTVATQVSK